MAVITRVIFPIARYIVILYVTSDDHDDVIKRKHYPSYWPFVRGIHRWPVTQSFGVFFDLHLNKRLSKQWWGWWFETPSHLLWHHCNVHDRCGVEASASTMKTLNGHFLLLGLSCLCIISIAKTQWPYADLLLGFIFTVVCLLYGCSFPLDCNLIFSFLL